MGEQIQLFLSNRFGSTVREESLNGRKHLVAPMTMIVPGVLPGSNGAILYPRSKINERPNRWNGMPIVVNHPEDELGKKVSAREPEVIQKFGIGQVFNAKGGDKLTAEAWIDIEKTLAVEPRIIEDLKSNKKIELSTGLYTKTFKRAGNHNGATYNQVLSEFDPDHLAILPDDRGACNLDDGCGLNVNILHEDELGFTELVENKELPAGKKLNKPFRTPGGPKKFGVYTKNDKGNIVLVRFGDPNLSIKRDDPNRRKSFRARHGCDKDPGPKWKAKYWSCRFWEKGKSVSSLLNNEFKPHMMYCPKSGRARYAKTYEEHLKLKKQGFTHTPKKTKNHAQHDQKTHGKGSLKITKTKPKYENDSFDEEWDFKTDGGTLSVVKSKWSPTDWSITETYTEEDKRGQGIATALIKAVKGDLKGSIGAQTSTDASTRLYWKQGFRLPKGGTLEDAYKIRKENSSVNLIFTGNHLLHFANNHKKHDQKTHGRGKGKTVTTKGGKKLTKSQVAKKSQVRVAKDIQRYAEEYNEPIIAKALGGKSLSNNEAADIVIKKGARVDGIELKTLTVGKNRKITIKRDAKERKAAWERKNKGRMHTVVLDDTKVFNAAGKGQHDFSQRRIFYRRGYGSFRVDTMYEVSSMSELKSLIKMDGRSLPEGAK
jgi:predicted GNAT family acetyltransferase